MAPCDERAILTAPIERFREWLAHAKRRVEFAEACCLSTIGLDDWPNARFVALKQVTDQGFVVTGPIDSRKGRELERVPRAALTFWWPEVLRQIRIQGEAQLIGGPVADRLFSQRDRNAQVLAWASRQGRRLTSIRDFEARVARFDLRFRDDAVQRPPTWSGYRIAPIRIEFLSFRHDRMHVRVEWSFQDGVWAETVLQP